MSSIPPRMHDTIEKVSGRRPICRASYVSRCCAGPVDVYMGKPTFTADFVEWSVPFVRRCALCGLECEGQDRAGEPGSR